MSIVAMKSGTEQCLEYAERQRFKARMEAANQSLENHLDRMSLQYGGVVTVGVLARQMGILLVTAPDRACIAECRGYLARKIIISLTKKLLTLLPMLH